MTTVFIITAATVLVYMTGWFIAAQIRGRNDIADVAWGLGFILASLTTSGSLVLVARMPEVFFWMFPLALLQIRLFCHIPYSPKCSMGTSVMAKVKYNAEKK